MSARKRGSDPVVFIVGGEGERKDRCCGRLPCRFLVVIRHARIALRSSGRTVLTGKKISCRVYPIPRYGMPEADERPRAIRIAGHRAISQGDESVIMYVRAGGRLAKQPLSCGGVSMAELEIFLYTSCTSCRKAVELLREKGINAKRRDYFKDRFTKPELIAVLDRAGVTPFDVLSTRSNPYRELGLAERTLTENELLELMVAHPQLLKRPLIIKNG